MSNVLPMTAAQQDATRLIGQAAATPSAGSQIATGAVGGAIGGALLGAIGGLVIGGLLQGAAIGAVGGAVIGGFVAARGGVT